MASAAESGGAVAEPAGRQRNNRHGAAAL